MSDATDYELGLIRDWRKDPTGLLPRLKATEERAERAERELAAVQDALGLDKGPLRDPLKDHVRKLREDRDLWKGSVADTHERLGGDEQESIDEVADRVVRERDEARAQLAAKDAEIEKLKVGVSELQASVNSYFHRAVEAETRYGHEREANAILRADIERLKSAPAPKVVLPSFAQRKVDHWQSIDARAYDAGWSDAVQECARLNADLKPAQTIDREGLMRLMDFHVRSYQEHSGLDDLADAAIKFITQANTGKRDLPDGVTVWDPPIVVAAHSIAAIRDAFDRAHARSIGNPAHYMSIPADRNRDADLILSEAIDELALRRKSMWHTHPDDQQTDTDPHQGEGSARPTTSQARAGMAQGAASAEAHAKAAVSELPKPRAETVDVGGSVSATSPTYGGVPLVVSDSMPPQMGMVGVSSPSPAAISDRDLVAAVLNTIGGLDPHDDEAWMVDRALKSSAVQSALRARELLSSAPTVVTADDIESAFPFTGVEYRAKTAEIINAKLRERAQGNNQ